MQYTLNDIRTGVDNRPPRILIHGKEGIGKTTFASQFPDPIFIMAEEGTGRLSTSSLPPPKDWDEFTAQLDFIASAEHQYKTLVIDTGDAVEKMIWEKLCQVHNVKNIEDVDKGWGKGYIKALDYWAELIRAYNWMRNELYMGVVIICHSTVRPAREPDVEPYDQWVVNLDKRAMNLLVSDVDIVGFYNVKTIIKSAEDSRTKKVTKMGVVDAREPDARYLFVNPHPAFVAKNRYNLPSPLKIERDTGYSDFANALQNSTKEK